jgi:S-adenosylmethionine:tRNA ribosyltransferase-isomerase
LAVWDTWTTIASRPVAFEAPSAGFLLDWRLVDSLRARGATFVTLTHAAGISSTGDPRLDAMLPSPRRMRSSVQAIGSVLRHVFNDVASGLIQSKQSVKNTAG